MDCPVRFSELKPVVIVAGDMPSVLMQESVVELAQKYQIVQVGASAQGPALDVVGVKPSLVSATWKLAVAVVAVIHQATQPTGNGP